MQIMNTAFHYWLSVYTEYWNNRDAATLQTGKYWHNYDTEIRALKLATDKLLHNNHDLQPVEFLTDTESVLQTLQSRKLPVLQNWCLN